MICRSDCLVALSLVPAEDVHPDEGTGTHVDHSGCRRHQQEVEALCWQPEHAARLECGKQFVAAFLQQVLFALHDTHADVENHKEGRGEQKLVQEQLLANDWKSSAHKSPIKPFVPGDVEHELRALDTDGTGLIAYDVFCNAVSEILKDAKTTPGQQDDSGTNSPVFSIKSSVEDELCSSSSSSPLVSPAAPRRPCTTRSSRPSPRRYRVRVANMLSKETATPAPSFIVTTSPNTVLDEERHTVEGSSLTDMDSALGSPSLELDPKSGIRNNSSSQCSSLSDGENYECLGEGSPGGAVSPVPGGKGEPPSSGGGGHLRRNTWSRSSLRRTPHSNGQSPASGDHNLSRRWGSFRQSSKRVTGSNVPTSPLYRSASFNSSGRSSNCGDADDMYCSDASLEEDVLGLNRKVQMLQQQVSALADTQNNTDDRYGRMRQENAMLQARVMILEEQLREEQVRTEERLQDETRRHREIMTRVEREKQLELENGVIRLQAVERKASSLEDEVTRLRAQTERQALARHRAEETIGELEVQLHSLRTEHAELQEHSRNQQEAIHHERATSIQLVEDLRLEVESLRTRTSSIERGTPSPAGGRGAELEAEVRALREESRGLREALEEAQAQLLSQGLEQGRTLLGEQPVLGLVGTSLADELEEMSSDKLHLDSGVQLEQVRLALREQQEVNMQLRSYIDGILLNIVENYPQLLEVKSKNNK